MPRAAFHMCAVSLAFLFLISSAQAWSESLPGKRVPVNSYIGWAKSGAWNEAGDTLFLADALRQKVVPISFDGTTQSAQDAAVNKLGFKIVALSRAGSGEYVFQSPEGDIVFIDSLDIPSIRGRTKLVERKRRTGPYRREEIGNTYEWEYSAPYFYTFANFGLEGSRWVSGFLQVPAKEQAEYDFLLDLRLSRGDPMRTFYRLGLNHFAAVEDGAYALIMDSDPFIVEAKKNASRLIENVSSACGPRPRIPFDDPGRRLINVYQALEKAEGPVGIYSQGGGLYLLCRKLVEDQLRFALALLDLNSGKAVDYIYIDTKAKNLTVIPGPTYWAFVEEGPTYLVEDSTPHMEIESIFFADSHHLAAHREEVAGVKAQRTPSPVTVAGSQGASSWGSLREWIFFLFSGVGLVVLGKLWSRYRKQQA